MRDGPQQMGTRPALAPDRDDRLKLSLVVTAGCFEELMCKQCDELAKKYYPSLNDKERFDLLIGATCFPFGGPDKIEPQLIELLANTDGSLEQAFAYSDTMVTQEMELWAYRAKQEPMSTVECGAGI